jgi:hypothetical protein
VILLVFSYVLDNRSQFCAKVNKRDNKKSMPGNSQVLIRFSIIWDWFLKKVVYSRSRPVFRNELERRELAPRRMLKAAEACWFETVMWRVLFMGIYGTGWYLI